MLEANQSHPIVVDLERMIQSEGEEIEEPKSFATLLYDVAALTSGYEIKGSRVFAQRIMTMMTTEARSDVRDAEVEAKVVTPDLPEEKF